MAIFELEALRARHGDCLILHYGPEDDPQRILIDGGPAKVYEPSLRPRLEELRREALERGQKQLRFRMLLVSHIDDDHINGVLELLGELEALDKKLNIERPTLPYFFDTLWHNSFDDLLGNGADELRHAALDAFRDRAHVHGHPEAEESERGSGLMSAEFTPRRRPAERGMGSGELERGNTNPNDDGPGPGGEAVAASVPQGRELRVLASRLGIPINSGLPRVGGRARDRVPRLVVARADNEPVNLGHGLSFRILGPSLDRVERLGRKWDKELVRKGLAAPSEPELEPGTGPDDDGEDVEGAGIVEPAAFVDRSVFNLASLVILAELGGKRMLLPGDARGDDILEGLEEAGLMTDFRVEVTEKRRGRRPARQVEKGGIHVDLLKLPHHGSDRNVTTDFFRRVRADRYVISGDGRFGNPEPTTFEMIFEARGAHGGGDGEPFVLELTYGPDELHEKYPVDELRRVLDEAEAAGIDFELVVGESADLGADPQ